MLNACDIDDDNIFYCDFYKFPFYSMIVVEMMMMDHDDDDQTPIFCNNDDNIDDCHV